MHLQKVLKNGIKINLLFIIDVLFSRLECYDNDWVSKILEELTEEKNTSFVKRDLNFKELF